MIVTEDTLNLLAYCETHYVLQTSMEEGSFYENIPDENLCIKVDVKNRTKVLGLTQPKVVHFFEPTFKVVYSVLAELDFYGDIVFKHMTYRKYDNRFDHYLASLKILDLRSKGFIIKDMVSVHAREGYEIQTYTPLTKEVRLLYPIKNAIDVLRNPEEGVPNHKMCPKCKYRLVCNNADRQERV